MCFFKSLELGQQLAIEPCQLNCHQAAHSALPLISYFQAPLPIPNQNLNPAPLSLACFQLPWAYLPQICAQIQANNQNLTGFSEKLSKNEKILQFADEQITHILKRREGTGSEDYREPAPLGIRKKTSQVSLTILAKLFGKKNYKYRLRLKNEFPKIIYKERRLKLSLRLVAEDGTLPRNANLLHLCINACDLNGTWIVGENQGFFMQGRTEVDLYKGEGEFEKIYPSDISRRFPGGKITLVIYPKPSLLNMTGGMEKGEAVINHEEIEPLCLESILIKAKKRQKY